MARPRKNSTEKMNGHRFYSTDFQFQKMTEFANECGLTFSQFMQKIAEAVSNEKDRTRLVKALKLTKAEGFEPELLELQRQARTAGITQELKARVEELKQKNKRFYNEFEKDPEVLPGQTDLFDDKEIENE